MKIRRFNESKNERDTDLVLDAFIGIRDEYTEYKYAFEETLSLFTITLIKKKEDGTDINDVSMVIKKLERELELMKEVEISKDILDSSGLLKHTKVLYYTTEKIVISINRDVDLKLKFDDVFIVSGGTVDVSEEILFNYVRQFGLVPLSTSVFWFDGLINLEIVIDGDDESNPLKKSIRNFLILSEVEDIVFSSTRAWVGKLYIEFKEDVIVEININK